MTIDIGAAKARLAALKAEIAAMSASTADWRAPVELDQQSVGRLSRMDALQQQALAASQERSRQRDLVRIEMAERRLAEGDYGYCVECGEEIAPRRLEIDPMAEKCVTCAGR